MNSGRKNIFGISSWLILGAVGLFLIFFNRSAQDILSKIFAAGLILTAASGILAWWRSRKYDAAPVSRIIGSAVLLLLGLWIFTHTESFTGLLNKIIGLIVVVLCGTHFMRGWQTGRFRPVMILSALGIIAGFVIFFWNAGTGLFVTVEGISLVYAAVTGYLAEKRLG